MHRPILKSAIFKGKLTPPNAIEIENLASQGYVKNSTQVDGQEACTQHYKAKISYLVRILWLVVHRGPENN